MAKTVKEVLSKVKGDKINDVLTGKGVFSQAGFSDLVSAMANDSTFKIKQYGKDGKVTGEVSISDLIREDFKKTLEKAKYPQKSEASIIDSCEIVTNGLAKAIPQIVMQQIMCGKKFDLPAAPKVNGSIYLAAVPGKTRTDVPIRDPKSKQTIGSVTTKTKDSIQIRAKSPVPEYLQEKIRKDANGKVISK